MKGRTRAWIAARAGLDVDTTQDVIAARTSPRLDTASRIAAALGVSLDRFARAWLETRRRRLEAEAAKAATRQALEEFRRGE